MNSFPISWLSVISNMLPMAVRHCWKPRDLARCHSTYRVNIIYSTPGHRMGMINHSWYLVDFRWDGGWCSFHRYLEFVGCWYFVKIKVMVAHGVGGVQLNWHYTWVKFASSMYGPLSVGFSCALRLSFWVRNYSRYMLDKLYLNKNMFDI